MASTKTHCNDCGDVLGGSVYETDLGFLICHTCHVDSPFPGNHELR